MAIVLDRRTKSLSEWISTLSYIFRYSLVRSIRDTNFYEIVSAMQPRTTLNYSYLNVCFNFFCWFKVLTIYIVHYTLYSIQCIFKHSHQLMDWVVSILWLHAISNFIDCLRFVNYELRMNLGFTNRFFANNRPNF